MVAWVKGAMVKRDSHRMEKLASVVAVNGGWFVSASKVYITYYLFSIFSSDPIELILGRIITTLLKSLTSVELSNMTTM